MTFFFQRKNPLKPVDFIFSSNNTSSASMEIATSVLAAYTLKTLNNNENSGEHLVDICNTNNDLEVFKSISSDSVSLAKSIDNTYTFMGRSKLRQILENPTADIKTLKKRQAEVKAIKRSNKYSELIELLKGLKEQEKSVLWILRKKSIEEQHILDSLFFKNRFLSRFNSNEKVMNIYNYFRIIFAPLYGLLSPLMFMLIPFLYLRLFTGVRIPFSTYMKLFKLTLFGGIPDPIDLIRTTQSAYNSQNPEMMRNLLGSAQNRGQGIKMSKVASMLFSLILYIQNVMNSFEISGRTRETIDAIHSRLNDCSNYIENANKLVELTDEILDNKDENIDNPFPILSQTTFRESPHLLSDKGAVLVSYKQIEENTEGFHKLLCKIGDIDFLVNSSQLLNSSFGSTNYEFAEYMINDKPQVIAKDIWHPCLDRDKVVLNSVSLGNPNPNMVITGPNAGGKSTFIKSITVNILLSQTLGIVAGSGFKLTPFKLINTYLNIPDVKGKESLFEAEMHRAREHLDKLGSLDKDKFSFLIMDEIFSSTNPEEGISGGYAICEMLGKFPNSISIITTHFTKLTDLEKTSNFSCYKIPINRDSNGDIEYTYKLEPGVSDQFIALELLGKKGFDRDIVNRAISLCSDIRKPPEEPIEPVAPEKIPPKPKRVRKTKAKKPVEPVEPVDNKEDKIETEELILKNETETPKD
jgi:DNA mismatch repair protein MutS